MSSSLLYPSRCILCGSLIEGDKLICADCVSKGLLISGRICGFCGVGVEYCDCGHRRKHYIRRIACVYYNDPARRIFWRFKFHRHTTLGEYYGRLMAENVKSKYQSVSFDGIVPVPMHWFDRWKRGYNCTQLLALRIKKATGLPILSDVLYKRSRSKPQKDIKDPAKRAANVLDAFGIKNAEALQDKTILLVDDVCTTGATLNECAQMLRIYGAKKVYAVPFATVVKGKDFHNEDKQCAKNS